MNITKKHCPNPNCPSHRRTRKGGLSRGRYLGESDEGAYVRFYCAECHQWYAWIGEKLVESGNLILEDVIDESMQETQGTARPG